MQYCVFMARTRSATRRVGDREKMLAGIRQADRQVKAGHYIRSQDMEAWLLSWGADNELPPPKCVCGKEHDDEMLCR